MHYHRFLHLDLSVYFLVKPLKRVVTLNILFFKLANEFAARIPDHPFACHVAIYGLQ